MAGTLADAFAGGYQAGLDIQHAGEREQAKTTLLSTQAEAAKAQAEAAKEESTYSQLTRQAFLKAQEANANLDASDLSQRVQLYDRAIQANRNNPEIQDRLYSQKQNILKQQVEQAKQMGELRKQKQQERADFVMESLIVPDVGGDRLIERARQENDPVLAAFGAQLKDQVPIAMFGNKKYSQLSPSEQDAYRSTVVRGILPKGETTAHNLIQEQINWADLRRKQEADEERARLKGQDIAAKREKQEAKAADTSRLTIEANKEIQTHRKNIRTLEMEQAKLKELYNIEQDITEEGGLPLFKSPKMPPAAQERYKLLADQITEEEQGIKDQTARLEAAGATPVPKGKSEEAEYTSAQDVKAAFQAGKISREEAKKQLTKFGYK